VKNPIVMGNGYIDSAGFRHVEIDEDAIEEMLIHKITLE
jgi:hypothetical protein